MTFAEFALTEARFRKHFRQAPRDTWNDNMMPLVEFMELDEEDREGKFPYIWAVDRKQRLNRVLVAKKIVESCEERRDFWIMLKGLAGIEAEPEEEVDVESKVRAEVVNKITQGLWKILGEEEGVPVDIMAEPRSEQENAKDNGTGESYMAPWLETEECTSCDECIKLNPRIFEYNQDKKAFIKDPKGGPYEDLVKAAEKCTARVIHPGLPADRSAKDVEKWIMRGEKFN